MLADARLCSARAGTSKELDQAERFHAQALAAWRNGQPVSAVQHFAQAVDRGFDVLARHGLGYDGADRDGDGVPDVLELRAGSNPMRGRHGPRWVDGSLRDPRGPARAPSCDGRHGWRRQDERREDLDGDGLTAAGEQVAASSPLEPDTDGDDLSDGAEIHTHGTKPTNADTDGDGLDDGAELRAGTDPLDRGHRRRRHPRRCRHERPRPSRKAASASP